MTRRPSPWLALAGAAACLALPARLRAQDFLTITRRDEVGPRELKLDEETFLNYLSFEHPLETIQPFLASDNAYRLAFGSLDAELFSLSHDGRAVADVAPRFRVRVLGRNALDFDSIFFQVQTTPEVRIGGHWWLGLPFFVDADKGNLDVGLSLLYQHPEAGLDYFQLSWVRSDPEFDHRSQAFMDSRITDPADSLELQIQGDLGRFGKTTFRFTDQLQSETEVVERGTDEKFRRLSSSLLHSLELDENDRLFLLAEQDSATEDRRLLPGGDPTLLFAAARDYGRVRLEEQHDLDADGIRRWRTGLMALYFEEDASGNGRYGFTLRREAYAYVGYRTPVPSLAADLETTFFAGRADVHDQVPYDDKLDVNPRKFQAKLQFYLRWALSDHAELVLTPSVGVDRLHWGGGGAMLRFSF